LRVLQSFSGRGAELSGGVECPKKGAGVEEEPHKPINS
jgi:hypothetical protein